MTGERCPTCGRALMVTAIDGPTAITIYQCSHEIGHMAALIDAPNDGDNEPTTRAGLLGGRIPQH